MKQNKGAQEEPAVIKAAKTTDTERLVGEVLELTASMYGAARGRDYVRLNEILSRRGKSLGELFNMMQQEKNTGRPARDPIASLLKQIQPEDEMLLNILTARKDEILQKLDFIRINKSLTFYTGTEK